MIVKLRNRANITRLIKYYYGISIKPKKIIKRHPAIHIISQDATTGPKSSFFIRLLSPLTSSTSSTKFNITINDGKYSKIPKNTSFVIIQRTAIDNLLTATSLVNNLKRAKIPFLVDSDDAFNLIDPSHPEYVQQKEKIEALNYLIKSANLTTFSTKILADFYLNSAKAKKVIPNTLDLRIWRSLNSPILKKPSSQLEMVYMGTATHDADFKMIFPVLEKLQEQFPGSFKLTVIGVSKDIPARSWIKREVQPKNGAIYPNFVAWFQTLGPYDIGLAPLVDSPFNKAKSDIKCLDYLAAGIAPVVSDVTAYATKGLNTSIIRVSNSSEHWHKTLAELLSDISKTRSLLRKKIIAGQDYILQQRTTQKSSKALVKEIERLLK